MKGYLLSKEKDKNQTFTRRVIRQGLNRSKSQVQRFMYELQSLEYIKTVGGHVNKGYQYQIIYWDDNGALRKELKDHLQQQLNKL